MHKRNKSLIFAGLAISGALALSIFLLDQSNDPVANSSNRSNIQEEVDTPTPTADEQPIEHSEVPGATAAEAKQDNERRDARAKVVVLDAQDYATRSTYGALPPSLTGSAIPNLYLDHDGNLVLDESVKDFIEYFLIAASEEGSEQVIARLQEYLTMALDGPAHDQALTVLDQYLRYREQLDSVVARDQISGDESAQMTALQEALDRRKALRREVLGEKVAQAMFDASEKYERYAVGIMKAQLDSSLTESERAAVIENLEQGLPEQIKKRAQYERQARTLDHQIATLQQQGGKEAEIFELRQAFYGEQAAQRMAFFEERSDEWQARVDSFRQSEQNILASTMLTDEQKFQQIDELRNQDFTEDEKLKMARQSLQREIKHDQ